MGFEQPHGQGREDAEPWHDGTLQGMRDAAQPRWSAVGEGERPHRRAHCPGHGRLRAACIHWRWWANSLAHPHHTYTPQLRMQDRIGCPQSCCLEDQVLTMTQ